MKKRAPDTEEAGPRRDFVTERATDLSRSERHAAVVKVEEAVKVDKVALSSFGAEVAAGFLIRSAIRVPCGSPALELE